MFTNKVQDITDRSVDTCFHLELLSHLKNSCDGCVGAYAHTHKDRKTVWGRFVQSFYHVDPRKETRSVGLSSSTFTHCTKPLHQLISSTMKFNMLCICIYVLSMYISVLYSYRVDRFFLPQEQMIALLKIHSTNAVHGGS